MIASTFANEFQDFEIVIIDGGSADGTIEYLKSIEHPRLRWLSEPDHGEYDATNKGVMLARGSIIKVMTDDDELRPVALGSAVEYFGCHPDIDIVFGQTAIWDERSGPRCLRECTDVRDIEALALERWLRESTGVFTVAAFLRRSVFQTIGMFSTEFIPGDVEFWVRAASAGLRMGLLRDIVADYYITGANGFATHKWRVKRDLLRIHLRYKQFRLIALCLDRHYLEPIRRHIFGRRGWLAHPPARKAG
jgi:glycosyltransferase involved in cell wall biosynthesis